MTANKPMTGEQLDELMTVAVNMQRDAETDCNRPSAMFAYAVQVAVLELRKVRNDTSALAAENAGLKSAIDATIGWQQSTDPENVESVRMLVDIKTPATDAFLAEVRAQGVEMMAAEADQLMDEFGDDSYKVMVTADLQRFANAFAAQLRQESAQ
ncbi:hypothetical protein ACOY6O_23240 [Enterobacter roggenkampii]|uniref:hypothetical protein n=1 Tax=Enterobacter roggenkampii TaxID=1812935 RepID=UPI003BD29C88